MQYVRVHKSCGEESVVFTDEVGVLQVGGALRWECNDGRRMWGSESECILMPQYYSVVPYLLLLTTTTPVLL